MKPFGRVMQLGHIVTDVKAEMARWATVFGVGPFIHLASVPVVGANWKGRRLDTSLSVALGYFGTTQIEFIAQQDATPSPYTEFLDSGRSGLHHLAFWTDDFDVADSRLVGAGYVATLQNFMGSQPRPNTYYAPPDPRDVMIELSYDTPAKRALYKVMRELADTWDGTEPVRAFPSMDAFAASCGLQSWTTDVASA